MRWGFYYVRGMMKSESCGVAVGRYAELKPQRIQVESSTMIDAKAWIGIVFIPYARCVFESMKRTEEDARTLSLGTLWLYFTVGISWLPIAASG